MDCIGKQIECGVRQAWDVNPSYVNSSTLLQPSGLQCCKDENILFSELLWGWKVKWCIQVYAAGKEAAHKHSTILHTWHVVKECLLVLEVAEPGFKLRSLRPVCFMSCHLLYYHLHNVQLHRNKGHFAIYAFLRHHRGQQYQDVSKGNDSYWYNPLFRR